MPQHTEIGDAILARLDTIIELLTRQAQLPDQTQKKVPPEPTAEFLDAYKRVVRDLTGYLDRQAAAGHSLSARELERRWPKLRGGLPISGRTLRAILRRAIQEGDLRRAPLGWLSAPPDR